MQETNYCAHAIDSLKDLRKLDIPPRLRDVLDASLPKLLNAAHFRLPLDGRVFDLSNTETISGVIEKYCPLLRLPYPSVALEFGYSSLAEGPPPEGTARTSAAVMLAYEQETGGRKYIAFYPFFLALENDGSRQWYPNALGAAIDVETRIMYPVALHSTLRDEEKHQAYAHTEHELNGSLTVLVQFLAALSCSNSATAESLPPNPALNTKRRKAGKTPFFTYKILTISGNSGQSLEAAGGGTHGSPRVHLRRGHIRRLPEKTVWVNACVVGDKSKGLVQKDYRVK